MTAGSEKSGFAKIMSWVIPGAIVAICAWWGYKLATKGPSDPILKEQLTPEGAMKVYAENASDFLTKDIDFNFIRKVILKDDWDWFQDNYKSFHEDTFNLSKGLHPMEGEAVAKVLVMRRILSSGPHRKDCEIINVNTSGNRSEITLRQLVQQGTKVEMKVEVIKEGKYWKMKDFGGGRQMIQNEKSPLGQRKYVSMNGSSGEMNDPVTGMYGSAGTNQTSQPPQPPPPRPDQTRIWLF
jgi:rhodanese-related sulfurtransferase